MSRINDKISGIESFLSELSDIKPNKFEEYESNNLVKAACERYVEKIVEAITDVAFLIIKNKKLKLPEDDIDAFNILLENKIINNTLATKLKNAKGMRNIIAHEYGKIDDRIVFESVTEELEKDAREFIKNIRQLTTPE